ncbi:diacylglycerol/lipid kinase family protein [Engelhardtia mirabilis]|uniref:Lipid kinase n=1 Tax=Engelhardtia mirabilis TaxID=2528011 RepID=A0A518BJW4_9BACT|nr:Putative lipid kinase [Planctomycetes bacterium Pla133]QDV01588.1 Putative lipid kinase [Planctomycetes bacterium Pla86]
MTGRSERRLPCIANPFAGGGRALDACARMNRRMQASGWSLESHTGASAAETRRFARELDLGDASAVAVAGGDETLFDVVNGLAERGPLPPIVVVPAGSGNSVAAVAELLRPRLIGAGARLDGASVDSDLLACITVTRHAGRGMRIAPAALLDDGELDLTVIRRGSRLRLAAVLQGVFDGSHVENPLVASRRLVHCSVDLEGNGGLVVDGELLSARRCDLRVDPRAARLLARGARG